MDELTLSDYFAVLRRWKKIFLAVTLVVMLPSLVCVSRWANYRSTAMIQIEQPEISIDATGGGNSQMREAADQHINLLQRKVLSTASLIEVITKFDLYAGARKSAPISSLADSMRRKIRIDLASGSLVGSKTSLATMAFTVSFDHDNPLVAQQVADDLVTRFLNQDLKKRRSETQETSAFLGAQLSALEASLSEQENNIADFQKKNGMTRPENFSYNQQLASSLTLNLHNIDTQIVTSEGALSSLRAQLAAVDPLISLQTQYTTLSAQYGPQHPDVVRIKHQIEALRPQQNKLNKSEDQEASSKRSTFPNNKGGASGSDNPIYLQLSAQVRASEEQHKALLEQRKGVQAQLENYQKALIDNPEAQKQMASLTRDYDNTKMRYREMKERKMAADMNEQMQKDRTGERLTLINPPELPLGTQPPRRLMIIGSVFVSLLGGLASVIAAQIFSQSVIGVHYLESIVGVAPLVAIPHISTREERKYSLRHRVHQGACAFWCQIIERVIPTRLRPFTERLESLVKRLFTARKRFTKV